MLRYLSGLSALFLAITSCQASPTGDDVVLVESADGKVVAYAIPPALPESELIADFLVGRIAEQTNAPEVAAARYASVAGVRTGDVEIAERAVFSALISGNYDTAREVATSAPGSVRLEGSLVRLVLAAEAIRAGDSARALDHLEDGRLATFNRIIAGAMAAWAALDARGLEAARAALDQSRTGDPLFDGVTDYQLGFIELAAGEEEAALATFERVWTTGVRLAIGAESHARLLAARGDTDRAEEIIDSFRESVGPNPAIERLSREIAEGGPIESGALDMRRGAAQAVYAPSAALAALTRDDQAGVYFTLALALDPELHAARTLWGDALDRAGRLEAAASALAEVPRDSEFYANARAQLAWVYRRMGLDEAAIATAEDALAFRPDRDLKIQLGDLFRSMGDHASAERVFTEIIDADSRAGDADWRILYARGAARERQDRWSEAEADLRAALSLEPNQPDVLNYLGYSLVDRGQKLDEAFPMIRRAVALRPDSGHIVDSLGWAYFRLGQYEAAVGELEKAVVLEPGDPTINDHLGDAYWMVGRRREAGYQWQRALSLDPAEDDAARIASKLENGLTTTPVQRADAGAPRP